MAISTCATYYVAKITAQGDPGFMQPASYTNLGSLFKKRRLQVKNYIHMEWAHVSDKPWSLVLIHFTWNLPLLIRQWQQSPETVQPVSQRWSDACINIILLACNCETSRNTGEGQTMMLKGTSNVLDRSIQSNFMSAFLSKQLYCRDNE